MVLINVPTPSRTKLSGMHVYDFALLVMVESSSHNLKMQCSAKQLLWNCELWKMFHCFEVHFISMPNTWMDMLDIDSWVGLFFGSVKLVI